MSLNVVDKSGNSGGIDAEYSGERDGRAGYPLATTGGGGSGGDASAANQTSTQAAPGSNSTKATGIQGVDGGKAVSVAVNNFPVTQPVSGTVSVSNFPAKQGVTEADGDNATLGARADTAATTDSGTFSLIALFKRALSFTGALGVDGTVRRVLSGSNGGLLPGQGTPTTTRTVVAANTATVIDVARANRIGYELKLETSPTAAVFISYTGTASASNYDEVIPSGAGIGTRLTPLFGFTTPVNLFSTATVTTASTSWVGA